MPLITTQAIIFGTQALVGETPPDSSSLLVTPHDCCGDGLPLRNIGT